MNVIQKPELAIFCGRPLIIGHVTIEGCLEKESWPAFELTDTVKMIFPAASTKSDYQPALVDDLR